MLGVAAYGHSFYVTTSDAIDNSGTLTLYPPFDKNRQPLGDSDLPGASPSEGRFLIIPAALTASNWLQIQVPTNAVVPLELEELSISKA